MKYAKEAKIISLALLIVCISFYISKNIQVAFSPSLELAQSVSVPTNGLLGYWTFDEGSGTLAGDSSGNSNSGTLMGNPSWVPGKVGSGALSFSGGNNYVTIPDSASLSSLAGSNGATISFWINKSSTGTTNGIMNRNPGRLFSIYSDANFSIRVEWKYGGSGTGGTTLGSNCGATTCVIPVGEWHHVAVIYDNPNAYIYIDGVLKSQTSGAGGPLNTSVTGPLEIGKYSTLYSNASLDDIRIYNRALTANEIAQVYGGPVNQTTTTQTQTTQTTTQTQTATQTQTGTPGIKTVKQDGTGDFTTIQACANAAIPGDTCLVYPGTYDEKVTTKSGGTDESHRIIFKANGAVTLQGFWIMNPYITVDGFDMTGGTVTNLAYVTLFKGGDYCNILNNTIRDGASGVMGIKWYTDSSMQSANNCIIRGNRLKNLQYTFFTVFGANHLFENNTLEHLNSRDFIYLFGHDHVFRRNIFRDGNTVAGVNNHPDWVQTFGNNGADSYNMLFEQNWIEDLQGDTQLGQLDAGSGSAIVNNIHDWTFRDNIFLSVSANMNHSVPGTRWEHNTFYRMAYSMDGVGIYATLGRGAASNMTLVSNAFVSGGSTPDVVNDFKGFYHMNGALLSPEMTRILVTPGDDVLALSINKDLVSNGYLVNPNGRLTAKARALTDISQFVIGDAYATYKPAVYDALVKTAVLDKTMRDTTAIDYNFVAGSSPNFPKKSSTCTDGIFTEFNFCEPHGINGGNPQFANISNPLGPDGIPFTLDDGLKPLQGSPLCGKGANGQDIGAYSCSSSQVLADGTAVIAPITPPVTNPPKTGDFNNDGSVNTFDWGYMNGAWNTSNPTYDLNHDGKVNTLDLIILIKNWTAP